MAKLVVVGLVVAVAAGCATAPSGRGSLPPEIDPKDPLAPTMLMQQGQVLVDENRIPDGLVKYRQALSLAPSNPTIHNLIGLAELKGGQAAEALEEFNKALVLAPTYSDARNNRGAAYIALGQPSRAETDFLHVLADRMYANRTGVYFNLGALYLSQGNVTAAEENLRRAAKPSGPLEAYLLLGRVQERLGRPDEAETTLREAMSRAPERADLALELGLLLSRQGRKAEARQLFERVLALSPGSPEAKEARAQLGT